MSYRTSNATQMAAGLSSLLFLQAAEASEPASPTIQNPLVVRGADPWILREDGWYYFTSTLGDRIEIRRSRTLGGLRSAETYTLWKAPASGPCARDIWAPEIHKIDGRWYVYFTGTTADRSDANRRVFVLRSRDGDPLHGFEEPRKIVPPGEDFYSIDGTTFDAFGRRYFAWSGRERSASGPQNIYLARMSDPMTISGHRVLISRPEFDWEKKGWAVNEGPEILKHDGRIFLVYSGSGFTSADYCLGMLTHSGGDVLDPRNWTKAAEPVFKSYTGPFGKAYGPGHNGFFKSPDGSQDWIVYHARDFAASPAETRSARAQPFRWNPDGTPDFGQPIPAAVALPAPSGEAGD